MCFYGRIREGENAFQEALLNFLETRIGWKKQEDIYLLEKKLKEHAYSFNKFVEQTYVLGTNSYVC